MNSIIQHTKEQNLNKFKRQIIKINIFDNLKNNNSRIIEFNKTTRIIYSSLNIISKWIYLIQ